MKRKSVGTVRVHEPDNYMRRAGISPKFSIIIGG